MLILMTPLRTHREWAVGVISTVVTGIGGGAIAVQYFGLQEWVDSVTGLVASRPGVRRPVSYTHLY